MWGLKILKEILPDEVETDEFYWNLFGTNEDMPNLWIKGINLQVEWYKSYPDRATFSNYETFSAEDVISLLERLRESYDLERDGK